jgi:hypothetical protein
MRKWLLLLATLIFTAAPLAAQQRLNIDIPGLADKAAETTDVTLDGSMLRLAAKFLNSDGDHAVSDIVKGLKAIYVRSYEFDKEGEYDRDVVDKVRSQLTPSWKRMVRVTGHRENTEIYLDMSNGDTPAGLLVLSAEPRELTIVHLVGSIDIDRLASLEGNFGIPHVSGNEQKGEHKGKREKKQKSDKDDDDE